MAKPKYTVTHAGQTFTRTTARTYSHVILGKASKEREIRHAEDQSAYDAKTNHPYYVRQASNPTYDRTEEETAQFRRIAALTQEQYRESLLAGWMEEIRLREGRGYYDHFYALTWCGRPDLAAKEVAKYLKSGNLQVFALEVPQP